MKLFRGSPASTGESSTVPKARVRATRRSSGLLEFNRTLGKEEGLCLLDIGFTSPANIEHFTGLGFKVYSEDVLLASQDSSLRIPDENGKPMIDVPRFLSENLAYSNGRFDAILCWDLADYMDEPLVKPVVARMWSLLKPGGVLLAFFHTRDAGPDAPYCRYHIAGNDLLGLQLMGPEPPRAWRAGKMDRIPSFRLQRVFNNRHIENLFRDFSSIKFFLARDNVREVLVIR